MDALALAVYIHTYLCVCVCVYRIGNFEAIRTIKKLEKKLIVCTEKKYPAFPG